LYGAAIARCGSRWQLVALAALDDAGRFPAVLANRGSFISMKRKFDDTRAYIVRLVAENHYRAAQAIASFPRHISLCEMPLIERLLAEAASRES
jgi:hypothetical protein